MVLDKKDFLEKGHRFQKQGKWDKALGEYRKAAAFDPANPELHNLLGDIHVRVKNISEAISCYIKGAEIFIQNGEREKAVAIYKKVLRLDSQQGPVHSQLGAIYSEMGLIGEAISHYRIAAGLYEKNGPRGESIKIYQKLLQLLPQDTEVQTRLREMGVQESGRLEGEKPLVVNLIAKEEIPSSPEVSISGEDALNPYYTAGLDHYRKGMFKEAMEDFRDILVRNPQAVGALYYIGQIFVKEGKLENALLAFQKALRINSHEYRVQEAIGDIYAQRDLVSEAVSNYLKAADNYLEQKDYSHAILVYQKILQLKPDNYQIHRRLVDAYHYSGEVEKAVELVLKIIDDFLKQGKKEESEKEIRHWVAIFPEHMQLRNKYQMLSSQPLPEEAVVQTGPKTISIEESENYREKIVAEKLDTADSYLQHDLLDEAENLLHEVLHLDPGNTVALSKLEEISKRRQPEGKTGTKELQSMLQEFRKGVEGTLKEEDYAAHYDLGIAYKEMGLLDEAIGEFEKAIKGGGCLLGTCNLLGLCYLEKNLLPLAVESFQKGLEIPSHKEEEYLDLLYNLGIAYEKMGEIDQEQSVFEEVYALDIDYRDVGQKLHEIESQKTSSKSRKDSSSRKNKISYL